MLSSVLFTGDAGGLPYIDDVMTEGPRKTFNVCCSCALPDYSTNETDLTPLKRKPITKQRRSSSPQMLDNSMFQWTAAAVAKYSNVEMMRKHEYLTQDPGQAPQGFSYYAKGPNGGPMTPGGNDFGLSEGQNLMSPCPYTPNGFSMQGPMTPDQLAERDEFIGAKFNKIFDQYMKKAKAKLDSQISHDISRGINQIDRAKYNYQMEVISQKIKFDVAWKIFDEINERNETYKHIDLSCLDFNDAIAITKQKVYDLAKFVAIRNPKTNMYQIDNNYVLNIKCAEDHMLEVDTEFGTRIVKNGILEMIQSELALDQHYIPATRTILVRVNDQTIDIPCFGGL